MRYSTFVPVLPPPSICPDKYKCHSKCHRPISLSPLPFPVFVPMSSDLKYEPSDSEKKTSSVEHDVYHSKAHDGMLVIENAEGEGLQRQLKNRHAQMISIGGVIGTGLFLGTAGSLASAGPAGLLLGYLIVSSVCVGGE